jgi:lipopolysaccharide transport system permease protein
LDRQRQGLAASLLEPYKLLLGHRKLLWDAVKHAVHIRHAGSVLGLGWLVLGPVILLALYALMYAVIFQIRPQGLSLTDYILYIFAGLVPFISFSQALAAGSSALTQSQALLLNRVFPAELIPVREVLAAGTFLVIGGLVVLVGRAATGGLAWSWLLLPVILLLMTMATMGVVWGLSLAHLVFKDIQQIIGYLIIVMLIASPIAYTPDMVPASLRMLLYVNPFGYYVMAFQSVLVLGEVPPAEIMIGCVVFAFVLFHAMYHAFKLGKVIVADHI